MCGRYFLLASPPELAEMFDVGGFIELTPRYNIAPTQPVAVVRVADHARELVPLRWGLIPTWAKDGKAAPINARSETAAEKPTFRHALLKRRCLVPASGFYEWQATAGKKKQPFCIRLADDRPFAFAGLWDRWEGPDGAVESCCILTTAANDLMRPVHDRMPVIVEPQHYDLWIDRAVQEPAQLADVLRPFPTEAMRAYAVNPWVNDARHDDARCLEPAA